VPHCTPEQLALAALREPLPAEDAAHLAACDACRAEVASLQRSVDVLAVPELAAPGTPVAPPPQVWASIATATGVSATPRTDAPAARTDAPAARTDAPAATPPSAAPPEAPPAADVVPLRPRRRTWALVAAAAVAGGIVGAGVVTVLGRDDAGTAVAAAALDPLDDAVASGDARGVERADGTRLLEVDLSAPALDDAYYEVWLLRPDVSGLVPVGVAQAGTSVFELPAGLDLGEFPVVDVSVEPLDGDPAHSGDSVVRGALDT
jgi:hypothetical protein